MDDYGEMFPRFVRRYVVVDGSSAYPGLGLIGPQKQRAGEIVILADTDGGSSAL